MIDEGQGGPEAVAPRLVAVGRFLLAMLFLGGAAQKILNPVPVQEMLEWIHLPPDLVWLAAVFNIVAGLALIANRGVVGTSIALAIYCLVTSLFHGVMFDDPWQVSIMVKNWAIAGGLLILAANEFDRQRRN